MSDIAIGAIYLLIFMVVRDRIAVAYGAMIGMGAMALSAFLAQSLLPSIGDPWAWYAVCWLISYGMYIGFSWIGLTRASIVASVLVAFQAFMVLDAYMAPHDITAAYTAYPYIITAIHFALMATLITERGGSVGNSNSHPHRRRSDKGHHNRVEGGK